ncbi:MAG: hypothetical protein KA436_06560 [Oligoflexales bacterium]|nr:hypothetical protein [Oligoflexales bacterium]
MAKIVPAEVVIDKRLEKFLKAVHEICRSSNLFYRKIDVADGYIAFRASQTGSDIRNAMTRELIASVLLHGKLNQKQCKMSNPIKLVMEGRLKTLSYTKYNPIEEVKCDNVAMRVVVREGSPKHLVVTLYHLKEQDTDSNSLPEVPSDVW